MSSSDNETSVKLYWKKAVISVMLKELCVDQEVFSYMSQGLLMIAVIETNYIFFVLCEAANN